MSIVNHKDVAKELNVAKRKAQQLLKNTRTAYGKKRGGSVTMAQVKRANKLEP